MRKHSFRNKITLQGKVSDFHLPVPWVFNPYPSDHFLAPNVKWRKEGALRRREELRQILAKNELSFCSATFLPSIWRPLG